MTIAEIIEEARRLDERVRVYHADNHRMLVSALNDRANFYATHFPLLVAVAEAAVELRAKMRATYADPRYMNVWATAQEYLGPYTGPNWIAEAEALDAALRGEGQKP